jgi:nucleotide-binding universal stress UspA family protein
MGYNKILVPLDGSDLSEVALKQVPKIANCGAKICLLSVLVDELVSVFPELWPPDAFHRRKNRETYLMAIARTLRQQGYETSLALRSGPAIDNIVEVAQAGFDIVVMATHRRAGFDKFILGSVSEGVLHRVHRPVLII